MTLTSTVLTPDAVLALATDSGSAANARKLATPGKWQNLNAPGGSVWGQCQGSGKEPYLTGVDLGGPVGKCSCPSRKFPCKHALALLLLHATHPNEFGQAAPPESLQTWLDGRAQRAESRTEAQAGGPAEEGKAAPDPAAQAKRRAAREKKVTDGLEGLQIFLTDLIRDGLAHASSRPYADWDTQAARLVDAQAPGAARLVRRIPEHLGQPAALLGHLSRLYLLTEAWPRRDGFSESEQADLRAALGFPLDQAALLEAGGVRASWRVMGQQVTDEEVIRTRRTWLLSGDDTALLLDFSAGGRPFPPALPPGATVQAELCFAPGSHAQRAVVKGEPVLQPDGALPPGHPLDALLDRHGAALALNPWLERTAHVVGPVWLLPGEPWRMQDTGGTLPLGGSERTRLTLLAYSGGQPVTLFGEWDGVALSPLSLLQDGAVIPMRPGEES